MSIILIEINIIIEGNIELQIKYSVAMFAYFLCEVISTVAKNWLQSIFKLLFDVCVCFCFFDEVKKIEFILLLHSRSKATLWLLNKLL